MVKAASVALGLRSMLLDMDIRRSIRIKTDASAARGIASRRELGKVRHMDVTHLWLQEKVLSGEIELIKIDGKINRADALTKNVGQDHLDDHCRWLCLHRDNSRHEEMPMVTAG